jgi:hypothetical protein
MFWDDQYVLLVLTSWRMVTLLMKVVSVNKGDYLDYYFLLNTIFIINSYFLNNYQILWLFYAYYAYLFNFDHVKLNILHHTN